MQLAGSVIGDGLLSILCGMDDKQLPSQIKAVVLASLLQKGQPIALSKIISLMEYNYAESYNEVTAPR